MPPDPLTQALRALVSGEATALAAEFVTVPSHLGVEHVEEAMVAALESRLAAAGLVVTRQEVLPGRSNIIARLPGREDGPALMLNGHLDTVPPGSRMPHGPFAGTIHEGRLYGRGSADMKGSLAAMTAAVLAVTRSGLPLKRDLLLGAVVAEESGNVGAFHLAHSTLCGDCVVVGEPSSFDVVIAHKGVDRCRVIVEGRAAHASMPELGTNAINRAAAFIREMEIYVVPALRSLRHPLLGAPTINIGTIQGGRARNMVPDECTLQIEMRLVPGQAPDALCAALTSVAERMTARGDASRIRVEREPDFGAIPHAPLDTPRDHPLVRAVERAALAETGAEPRLIGLPVFTDAAVFASAGKAAVVFGAGHMTEAHTDGESIDTGDIETAARIFVRLAVDACA